MLFACTLWLKLVSYAHANFDMRAIAKASVKVMSKIIYFVCLLGVTSSFLLSKLLSAITWVRFNYDKPQAISITTSVWSVINTGFSLVGFCEPRFMKNVGWLVKLFLLHPLIYDLFNSLVTRSFLKFCQLIEKILLFIVDCILLKSLYLCSPLLDF